MIRLVLDTSALTAYLASSMGVGETLAEIADEVRPPAYFAVPLQALIEAARSQPDVTAAADQLELLLVNPRCILAQTPADGWRYLAELANSMNGRADLAIALALAEEHNAVVLTGEAASYPESAQHRLIAVEDQF